MGQINCAVIDIQNVLSYSLEQFFETEYHEKYNSASINLCNWYPIYINHGSDCGDPNAETGSFLTTHFV